MDLTEERRIHTVPTPRIGGIAVFLGFVVALFAVLGLALSSPYSLAPSLVHASLAHRYNVLSDQFETVHRLVGLLFGSLLILGVGLWDDLMEMRPRNKFIAQIVVALISMLYGFIIPGITNPFDHNRAYELDRLSDLGRRAADAALVRRHDERDQLHRRTRRAARRSHGDLERLHVLHFRRAREPRRRDRRRRTGGRGARLLAVQLQSGPHLSRRRGLALHRLRLRDGLDHRHEQDRDCDQPDRSAVRSLRCPYSIRPP